MDFLRFQRTLWISKISKNSINFKQKKNNKGSYISYKN
jgi:hypothetical protein